MFGTEIVCYLFLGGAGAGACFVLAVMGLLVPRAAIVQPSLEGAAGRARSTLDVPHEYRVLFAPAFAAATLVLVLGVVFLLVDVGRVDQLLLLLTRPTLSYIVVGAYALALCVVLAAVLALAWGGFVRRMGMRLLVVLEVAVLLDAVVVMVYTGLLLHSMRAVPLWHSPWLPALFVLSSVSCGFALVVGIGQFSGAGHAFASVMRRAVALDAAVIVLEALVAALLVATVALGAQASEPSGTMVAAAQSVTQLLGGSSAPLVLGRVRGAGPGGAARSGGRFGRVATAAFGHGARLGWLRAGRWPGPALVRGGRGCASRDDDSRFGLGA